MGGGAGLGKHKYRDTEILSAGSFGCRLMCVHVSGSPASNVWTSSLISSNNKRVPPFKIWLLISPP